MGWEQIRAYLFTAASKTLDYRPAQLERKGWLRGVGTGDGVAGTVRTSHCGFVWIFEVAKTARGVLDEEEWW